MDPLRMVKDDGELALMTEAQRVAGIGMDRARELLRPGRHGPRDRDRGDLRDDARRRRADEHADLRHLRDRDLHAPRAPEPASRCERGELAVIDLTPQVEGYCANLARTFVLGEPDERQRALLDAYAEVIPAVRDAMRPGTTVARARRGRRRGAGAPRPRRVPRPRHRARAGPALRGDAGLDDHPAAPERPPAGGHDDDDRAHRSWPSPASAASATRTSTGSRRRAASSCTRTRSTRSCRPDVAASGRLRRRSQGLAGRPARRLRGERSRSQAIRPSSRPTRPGSPAHGPGARRCAPP